LAQAGRDLLLHRSAQSAYSHSDFADLADLEAALFAFQYRYEKSAAPFRWTFTRADLAALMQRLKAGALPAAA
jgi:hypothetical protein